MAASVQQDKAKVFAERLNVVPIALFSLWLGPMLLFWAQAFGPLRPYSVPPISAPPGIWFAFSIVSGAATLFLLQLPTRWYEIQPFEKSGGFYTALGARMFRRFVTNGDYINRLVARRHPQYRVHSYSQRLKAAAEVSVHSERSHLVALVAGISPIVFALVVEWLAWAAWLTFTNIVCNLYPVLLQRFTRARLLRISKRVPYR